jgi:hypothetical protein
MVINTNNYDINRKALSWAIKRHNDLQCEIGKGTTITQNMRDELDTLSKNISLVKSRMTCQKCHDERKRIQFHHLIMRCYKEIMPINQYTMIRHNYKTIIVLCKDCHQSYHGRIADDTTFISEERIKEIMRDYFEQKKP